MFTLSTFFTSKSITYSLFLWKSLWMLSISLCSEFESSEFSSLIFCFNYNRLSEFLAAIRRMDKAQSAWTYSGELSLVLSFLIDSPLSKVLLSLLLDGLQTSIPKWIRKNEGLLSVEGFWNFLVDIVFSLKQLLKILLHIALLFIFLDINNISSISLLSLN